MSSKQQHSVSIVVATVVLASTGGCSVVIGLDKLSMQNTASNTSDSATPASGCKTNAECTDQATADAAGTDAGAVDGKVPAICLKDVGHCAPLLSTDCATVTGDYLNDRAVVIGSLFAIHGTTATQNIPRQQSATLAVEEINAAGGLPSTTIGVGLPLVMVSCDTTGSLVRAATHLVSDIKVPAIVGPNTSQDTLDVSNKVTIQDGVVVVSPSAVAASIADLLDNDLTWLMQPTDDQRGPLMAQDINSVEATLKVSRNTTTIKLSIIYRNDALGIGTRTSLDSMQLNGKPLTDAINAGSASGNVHIDPYDSTQTDFSAILTKEVQFAPDIVVLAGTAETVTKIMTPLEQQWTAALRPYYYFIDPSKGPELLTAVTGKEDLRLRVRGTGVRPWLGLPGTSPNDILVAFNLDYLGRYSTSPTASGTGPSYDATYAIAYALAATKDQAPAGATIAAGLRMLTKGTTITTGTQNLLAAFQNLASGNTIAAYGTTCPFAWDSRGVPINGTIEIWCIDSGATPAFDSSGLTWDIATGQPSGAYTQCM